MDQEQLFTLDPAWNTSNASDSEILGNMLAIMNGDGGHYMEEHGRTLAVRRAVTRWYKNLIDAETLHARDKD